MDGRWMEEGRMNDIMVRLPEGESGGVMISAS